MSDGLRRTAVRPYIHRTSRGNDFMRAETQAVADTIKQSLELLRRHL